MKTAKNRLTLDYQDMPDLKAALGGLEPGDRCFVEFEIMVVANGDNGLEGDIESVEFETAEDEAGENGGERATAEPTPDEPVMVVIARRKGAKEKTDDSKPAKKKQPYKEDL